jgi:hypothetical protein
MMKNEVTSEQASVLEKNKQVMQQFIRFINTGDRSIGETIIAPEVIFYLIRHHKNHLSMASSAA